VPSTAAVLSTPPSRGSLGGGGGEQSSAPRSTIVSTPRPTLSNLAAAREVDGNCPYISATDFRDAEGDRVGRVTVLQTNPVGCRFYFAYDPSVVVGEIRLQRLGTAVEAFNAVVTAARGHPEFVDDKTIGSGSISIKLPLQGTPTWACIFAKGNLVVTAHSRQTVVGEDARNIARSIAPKLR